MTERERFRVHPVTAAKEGEIFKIGRQGGVDAFLVDLLYR
jgi:hypothetical protein